MATKKKAEAVEKAPTAPSVEEKFEATKKALNNLLVAWRGGGDYGPALKEAQEFLDNIDKDHPDPTPDKE